MLRHQPDYHRKMMEKWGVEVRLDTEATVDIIRGEEPEVVVIATGAEPVIPDVDGMEAARKAGFVLTMDQVLARQAPRQPGKSVIIWGAGEGAELAIDLKRAGHDVRLLDEKPFYMPANYIGSRALVVMGLLAHSGIAIESGYALKSVGNGEAVFTRSDGSEEAVTADTLV